MGRKCLFAFVFKLISGLLYRRTFSPVFYPCVKEGWISFSFYSWAFLMNFNDIMPFLQTVSHKHDTLGAGVSVMFLRAVTGNGTDLC